MCPEVDAITRKTCKRDTFETSEAFSMDPFETVDWQQKELL